MGTPGAAEVALVDVAAADPEGLCDVATAYCRAASCLGSGGAGAGAWAAGFGCPVVMDCGRPSFAGCVDILENSILPTVPFGV